MSHFLVHNFQSPSALLKPALPTNLGHFTKYLLSFPPITILIPQGTEKQFELILKDV